MEATMEIFGVYLVNQSSGVTMPLYPDQDNIIGRGIPDPKGEKGKILLPHPSVSKLHAKIKLSLETHEWILVDTSRHGITVNGKRVAKQIRLKHGDKIQAGPFTLMFYEKFKADDETSEQPLPVLDAGPEKRPLVINILGAILLEGVLMVTFPTVLLVLSLLLVFFWFFMIIKPGWKEKLKISYRFLFLLLLLAAVGGLLSFYSITHGFYISIK
jgi:hypothetical protein